MTQWERLTKMMRAPRVTHFTCELLIVKEIHDSQKKNQP